MTLIQAAGVGVGGDDFGEGGGVRAAVAIISSVVFVAACALPADAAPAWSVRNDVSAPPSTELTAAACNTSNHCFAVGYRQTDTAYTPTIEQGNGATWSLMKSPDPTGATPNDLSLIHI